jgi:hypothetical protein
MSLNIDKIAETFCSHRFVETYPHMADEIKWNIVGREEIIRKIKLQAWPAVMSFNFRMGDLLRLLHTSLN